LAQGFWLLCSAYGLWYEGGCSEECRTANLKGLGMALWVSFQESEQNITMAKSKVSQKMINPSLRT